MTDKPRMFMKPGLALTVGKILGITSGHRKVETA